MYLFGFLYMLPSCFTADSLNKQQHNKNVPLPNDHVEVELEGDVFGNLFASYVDGIFLNKYA